MITASPKEPSRGLLWAAVCLFAAAAVVALTMLFTVAV